MTELRDHGLLTDDPVVAAMFLRCVTVEEFIINWVGHGGVSSGGKTGHYAWPVIIPYPTVWAAIEPVEGEGYVCDFERFPITDNFEVAVRYRKLFDRVGSAYSRYHKRVLNVVTTRAELRDLVRRCKEAV